MKTFLIGCISLYNPKNSSERTYVANDITVTAKQTNEAMIKFIMTKLNRDGAALDSCIAVCTPEVYDENGSTRTHLTNALDSFSAETGISLPEITYLSTEDETEQNSYNITLGRISSLVRKKAEGDTAEIYLDMAGGKRDSFIFIQLLTKLLSYYDYRVHAYYSDITRSTNTFVNADLLFRHMNILDAVNHFISYGNASYLSSLFITNDSVKPLLKSLSDLSNSIQLCSTNLTDSFNKLIKNIEILENETDSDPRVFPIKTMLPLIRKKFHLEKGNYSIGILGIVRWCIENGLVQQALTIYNENIADLIIEHGLVKINQGVIEKSAIENSISKYHHSEKTAQLNILLQRIADNMVESGDKLLFPKRNAEKTFYDMLYHPNGNKKSAEWQFSIASFYFNAKYLPKGVEVKIDTDLFRKILIDMRYVKTVRNTINHAAEQSVTNKLDYYFKFPDYSYPSHTNDISFTPSNIIKGLTRAVDNIETAISQVE